MQLLTQVFQFLRCHSWFKARMRRTHCMFTWLNEENTSNPKNQYLNEDVSNANLSMASKYFTLFPTTNNRINVLRYTFIQFAQISYWLLSLFLKVIVRWIGGCDMNSMLRSIGNFSSSYNCVGSHPHLNTLEFKKKNAITEEANIISM